MSEAISKTAQLYDHARQIIPSGTQLLSKRPEMMAPGLWPAYYSRAKGCETWDLDGRHYYDLSTNGIGACSLGFADPDVTAAVIDRIQRGSMCSLNPPEEIELADRLCAIHPWAQQARFTRGGGEACAVAVRIARAATGRSLIAICGYHGWHDWYLACNLGGDDRLDGHLLPGLDPCGVPEELRHTSLTFRYDHADELADIVKKHGDRLAAVIMEPCRNGDPKPGFLEFVREQTRQCGALLIFDEVTIGFRLGYGGAHLRFGITPDLAVFAKSIGNGHPIGAIIGTREAMHGAEISFISSTYWTEAVGPAAALATLKKMATCDLAAVIADVGNQVLGFWQTSARKYNLPVRTDGCYACLAHFRFDHPDREALRTYYTQLMLERGFLAGAAIYPTLAHTADVLRQYADAIDEVFAELAAALNENRLAQSLKGPVAHSGFRRLL